MSWFWLRVRMKVTVGDLLTPPCLHLLRKSLPYGREVYDSHANNTSAVFAFPGAPKWEQMNAVWNDEMWIHIYKINQKSYGYF